MWRVKDDVIALVCCTATLLPLLSAAAMLGHVFPVSAASYVSQQFSVAEEQVRGTLIGRLEGVRPPIRAYFRAGSDAERDIIVDRHDGSIRARSHTHTHTHTHTTLFTPGL